MPGEITAVATAITSIADLVEGVLSRSDMHEPIKELNEDITKVQDGFANSNLDTQWVCAYRLLTDVGRPITPGGTVGDTDRQFRHNALISIAELKYAKAIISRLVAQQIRK